LICKWARAGWALRFWRKGAIRYFNLFWQARFPVPGIGAHFDFWDARGRSGVPHEGERGLVVVDRQGIFALSNCIQNGNAQSFGVEQRIVPKEVLHVLQSELRISLMLISALDDAPRDQQKSCTWLQTHGGRVG